MRGGFQVRPQADVAAEHRQPQLLGQDLPQLVLGERADAHQQLAEPPTHRRLQLQRAFQVRRAHQVACEQQVA